jgi:transposase InsO family protein
MIIGMNIIEEYQMMLQPKTKEIIFGAHISEADDTDGWATEEGALRATRTTRIQPMEAHKVRAQLVDANGKDVHSMNEFVATRIDDAFAAKTDSRGQAQFYIKNPTDTEMVIDRYELVAVVTKLREEFTEPARSFDAPTLFQADAESIGRAGLTRNEKLHPEKRELVSKTVQRAPRRVRKGLRRILNKYHDVISKEKGDRGHTEQTAQKAKLQSEEQTDTEPFETSEAQMEMVKENVRHWIKAGIVEPSTATLNDQRFCVPENKGHGLRMVLDYRKVNAQTMADRYSIRGVEDGIAKVGQMRSRIFSKIELTTDFWRKTLEPRARKLREFTAPGMGQYQWLKSPKGLTGCPTSFARMMEMSMRGLINVITYADAILIHSETHAEHLRHLEQVMVRLRTNHLKINARKCEFATAQVSYLGHTLTPTGVSPGIEKTQAILKAKSPTTKEEVKSFLGLCNNFRIYIEHFAEIAAPIQHLTTKEADWSSGTMPDDACAAFEILQKKFRPVPVMKYPDQTGNLHLFVDATDRRNGKRGGLGAALFQEDASGIKRPIAYASRALKLNERNYTPFLLGLQATVHGVEFFGTYLKGRKFTLYTNHELRTRLDIAHTETLNRLQGIIQGYNFEIRDIKGANEGEAEEPLQHIDKVCEGNVGRGAQKMERNKERIKAGQAGEKETAHWIAISEGWTKDDRRRKYEIFCRAGILMVQLPRREGCLVNRPKMVLPETMRKEALEEAHNSVIAGRGGFFNTRKGIRERFWWPNMEMDVERHAKTCVSCKGSSNKSPDEEAPMKTLRTPQRGNDRIHIDLYDPGKNTGEKSSTIVVMTDAWNKVVRLTHITERTAANVADTILQEWIGIFGIPRTIVTDQGRVFQNDLREKLWTHLGVEDNTTAPYHPQINGQPEVFNKAMTNDLRTILDQAETTKLDWKMCLGPLMLNNNTAVYRSTKQTPFHKMFTYDPRAPPWTEVFPRTDEERRSRKEEWINRQRMVQQVVRTITHQKEDHSSRKPNRIPASRPEEEKGQAQANRQEVETGRQRTEESFKAERESSRKELTGGNTSQSRPRHTHATGTEEEQNTKAEEKEGAGQDEDTPTETRKKPGKPAARSETMADFWETVIAEGWDINEIPYEPWQSLQDPWTWENIGRREPKEPDAAKQQSTDALQFVGIEEGRGTRRKHKGAGPNRKVTCIRAVTKAEGRKTFSPPKKNFYSPGKSRSKNSNSFSPAKIQTKNKDKEKLRLGRRGPEGAADEEQVNKMMVYRRVRKENRKRLTKITSGNKRGIIIDQINSDSRRVETVGKNYESKQRLEMFSTSLLGCITVWGMLAGLRNGAAAPNTPKTTQDSKSTIIFQGLGLVAPSMGYAHVETEIDLTTYKDAVNRVQLMMPNEEELITIEKERATQLRLLQGQIDNLQDQVDGMMKLSETKDKVDKDQELLSRRRRMVVDRKGVYRSTKAMEKAGLWPKRERRIKRFITPVEIAISTAMGLFSSYTLYGLKKEMRKTDRQHGVMAVTLNRHESVLSVHGAEVTRLQTNIAALGAGLDQVQKGQFEVEFIIRVMIAFEGVEREVNRIQRIFNGAVTQGKLMPEILTKNGLIETFNDLQQRVTKAGFKLLIEGPMNLHQCDISFYTTGKGIAIFVHVPISDQEDLMKVYEYIPMPIPDEDNKDFFLTVQPKETILAVNKDNTRFKLLTKEQLNACKKIRDIFFCENMNVVRLADEDSEKDHEFCLLSLKKQRYDDVRRFCPITVAPLRDRVQQINALEFIVQQKESTQGGVLCPENDEEGSFAPRRNTKITLAPGCTGETATHRFKAMPEFNVKAESKNYEWEHDASPFVPRTTLSTYVSVFAEMDKRGYFEVPVTMIDFEQTLGKRDGGLIADVLYGIGILLLGIALTVTGWFFWKKHALLKMAAQYSARAVRDGLVSLARTSRRSIQTTRAEQKRLKKMRQKKERAEREQRGEETEEFNEEDEEEERGNSKDVREDEEAFERFIKYYETSAQAVRKRPTKVVKPPAAEANLTRALMKFGHANPDYELD